MHAPKIATMKNIVLILILCQTYVYSQNEQQHIINIELSRQEPEFINKGRPEIVGDSIVISKTIILYNPDLAELKFWCVNSKYLTAAEAEEIFGASPNQQYPLKDTPAQWIKADFPGHKVFIFDNEIHSPLFNSTPKNDIPYKRRISIGTERILHLSYPLMRLDNKYALIKSDSELNAGILSIYKNVNGKWQLYKEIYLYVS